jgi:capsular polysaccharide biosynthesis protein
VAMRGLDAGGCISYEWFYTRAMIEEPRQGTGGLAEFHEGDLVLQVGTIFRVIRRWFWIIVLTTMVCVGVAVLYSLQQPPVYQASIKILVGQDQGIVVDPVQAVNLQTLASTVSEAVATRPVGERVVRDLDLDYSPSTITAGTSAEVIPETQFIEVTYTDTEPRRTQRIANAIGEAISEQVAEVNPQASTISATVWERAAVPQSPVSPNPTRSGLIAFVVGIVLGTGLALLLDYLDDSWRSPEEAEHVSGVPTLGVVPEFESP